MDARPPLSGPAALRSVLPHRGVQFGEGSGEGSPPGQGSGILTALPLSEQLAGELQRISPQHPHPAQIEAVLGEVLAVCRVCAARSVSMQESAGDLLPLGSYHLGVGLPDDEVDVLFIAPQAAQLSDLQAAVSAEFGQRGEAKNMTHVGADGSLAAPGLRLELRGVGIKVIMTQRCMRGMPQSPLPQNMAGLYARETTEKILASVPNVESFRGLLRFVRYWAKKRGLYGRFLGFPGGMAWAIMCARACQMFPNLELAQLAARFFRTFCRWDWRQPVMLDGASLEVSPADDDVVGKVTTMSVLLPVGTYLSATSHVSETTMKIVQKEIRRGYKMAQQVELGKAHWTDVYKEAHFFQRHRHYLQFDFMATSEPLFAIWIQWAKQQFEQLVRLFEAPSANVVTLRPWPQWIEFRDTEWPHACAVFIGLHLERNSDGQGESRQCFDLREPIVKFLEGVSSWPEADKYTNQFELLIKHIRLEELEQWIENKRNGLVASSGGAGGAQVQSFGGQGFGVQHGRVQTQSAGAWPIADDPADALQMGFQQCSL